jgi:GTP-binding protein
MLPVVALVGRPNVGKSTLFNVLTGTRDALVADLPGLTRDRQYGYGQVGGRCIVIDTGGLVESPVGIETLMLKQTLKAIEEADVVLFVVDVRSGVTPTDEFVAGSLRRSGKPIVLVANKAEGRDPDMAVADFHGLGLGQPIAISAAHRVGVAGLMEHVLEGRTPELSVEPEALDDPDREDPGFDDAGLADDDSAGDAEGGEGADDEGATPSKELAHDRAKAKEPIRIAVIGRPNVGKSTLINRLVGEERVVAFDQPGTTRDTVHVPFAFQGQDYVLIDTAGVRRRARVEEVIEKFSVVKTLQAIDEAHVVLAVLDAHETVADQDASLLGLCADRGRAMVIVVNKWDGIDPHQRDHIRNQMSLRLSFLDYAPVHHISALHGSGVGLLLRSARRAFLAAMREMATPALTRVLEKALEAHQPPLVQGRRIKLRYAHQGGRNPPIIIVHGNQVEHVPDAYQRYLVNTFREAFRLQGTPVRVEFRADKNPFAGRKNELTPRQVAKRKRLIKHAKRR